MSNPLDVLTIKIKRRGGNGQCHVILLRNYNYRTPNKCLGNLIMFNLSERKNIRKHFFFKCPGGYISITLVSLKKKKKASSYRVASTLQTQRHIVYRIRK